MKHLVCEMCGCKNLLKEEGVFACQSCGCKYSVEEARKLMIDGTVHVDSAHLVNNYLPMANDAYLSDNKKDTEFYCNKIIEVVPNHTEALFLKGCAVGWQSKIDSFRFKEAAICFLNSVNSIENESIREAQHKKCEEEFKKLTTALIRLRCNRFSECQDQEEYLGFENDLNEILIAISQYELGTGIHMDRNNAFKNVTNIVQTCMKYVGKKIFRAYSLNKSRFAYATLTIQTNNCIEIIERTAILCDNDSESDVLLYKQGIEMISNLINENTTDAMCNRWGAYISVPRLSSIEESKQYAKMKELQNKIIITR